MMQLFKLNRLNSLIRNKNAVTAITRHFITFSAMDGGHAVPSSPIALQAGDKVIAKTMLKAGTSHRWIFNYAADTSDPRRFILFLNASSGGVVHYQSSLASEVRVDSVAIANVSQTYTDADLHTVEIDISGDALIDKIGSHDQVFESLKVVRNGQLYHDFDFNVDSSTDTIVDSAGSNITFSLVNVLPTMRQKVTWSDTHNTWLTENLVDSNWSYTKTGEENNYGVVNVKTNVPLFARTLVGIDVSNAMLINQVRFNAINYGGSSPSIVLDSAGRFEAVLENPIDERSDFTVHLQWWGNQSAIPIGTVFSKPSYQHMIGVAQ